MKKLFTFIVCASLSAGIYAADFFVDGAVATSGDGLSWETAKKTIVEAIALAAGNGTTDVDNIYVKAGTYSEQVALTTTSHDKVAIKGGFPASAAGTDISGRDFVANVTIIDGGGTRQNVILKRPGGNVDGFTIQNGNIASNVYSTGISSGVAIIGTSSSVVSNCIIKNNVRATSNHKGTGAGVYMDNGTLRDCQIFDNSTTHGNSQGAGINIIGGTVERCKIYNNTSGATGAVGGVLIGLIGANVTTYLAIIQNVVFANNIIYNNAQKGIRVNLVSGETKTVSLINNTIVNNAAVGAFEGAGIAQLTATNNILYNNGGAEMLAGTYTHNAIQATEVNGTGNIALTATDNSQTLFILPSTVMGKSTDASVELANWSLGSTSVCKDAGTGSGFGTTDIAGNDRVAGLAIDMGAYESSVSTALNTQSRTVSSVYSRQGGIVIGNASAYEIYSIDGRKLESGLSAAFVPMATGVYVVKTLVGSSREVSKVIVR